MHCLSWNKRNRLVTKLVSFVDFYFYYYFFFFQRVEDTAFLMACERKNRSLIFSDDMPTLGFTAPVENSASLVSLWNVDPQVGIFLFPLNINDEFYVPLTKTRGPWWSYIAHLSKQICILTVKDSAKLTALRFMYKFYSPAPTHPTQAIFFFLTHHDDLT